MGRVALITGGGTGVGEHAARLLASRGARVALVGRRPEQLERVVADIEADGGQGVAIVADLARADTPRVVIGQVLERWGQLDVLVNNAAFIQVKPIEEFSAQDFDEHVAVNVRSPFLLVQEAVTALRASPGAAIVNISSSSATMVRVGQSVYGMTKAALEYFTRSWAAELAPDRIRVNCLALGPVDTPIHATYSDDLAATHVQLASEIPLGRIARPQEIATWVAILADGDSAWVTGTVIPVDGGQVLDRS